MPLLTPFRRRGPVAVLTAAALASASALLAAPPALAAPVDCAVSQVDIVAHPDDDLLFQSPDLIDAIRAGGCVTTAYATAGDDGEALAAAPDAPPVYWQEREAGVKAAYATMAGVADEWTPGTAVLGGQTVATATLTAKPTVTLVFFRLPDGGMAGAGYPSTNGKSLPQLDTGLISSISSIDGATAFSRAGLSQALLDLMVRFTATTVHTQDFTMNYGDDDHDDHIMVSRLTRTVSAQYAAPHTLVGYIDYQNDNYAPNVLGAAYTAKVAAFDAYSAHDRKLCSPVANCADRLETIWLQRQVPRPIEYINMPAPVPTQTPAPAPAPSTAAPAPAPAPAPTTAAPAPVPAPTKPGLPAETGAPKAVLLDSSLTTEQFLTKGVPATFTGLTPGRSYQVLISSGDRGAVIGKPVVANAKGVVSGSWKPTAKASGLAGTGSFQLRLQGVQSTLDLAKTFTVKYDARLSWKSAHRSGSKVTFSVAAVHATASKDVAWKNVVVSFQKRVGSTWRTVAVDRADAKGVAVKTVKAGTSTWRAVVKATGTVWSATSKTVKR